MAEHEIEVRPTWLAWVITGPRVIAAILLLISAATDGFERSAVVAHAGLWGATYALLYHTYKLAMRGVPTRTWIPAG